MLSIVIALFAAIFILLIGKKWEIKFKIIFPWALLMAALVIINEVALEKMGFNFSSFTEIVLSLCLVLFITAVTILLFFFRDPERIPPKKERNIISPADGEIVYVKEIKRGEFPFSIKNKNHIPLTELTKEEFISSGGFQVGIGMNFLNVHVNRAPIAGKIIRLKRIPGKFYSLKKISSLLENERVCTIICGGNINVAIVQIASRLVRRIIPFIKEGDIVEFGQRIGMIRFGSQVDLLIPNERKVKILVKEKDEVKAGQTIIARY